MAEEVEILEEDARSSAEQPEPGMGDGQQSNTDISGGSSDVSDELRARIEDVTLSIYTARAGEIIGNGEYTIDHAFAEAAALLTRSANDQYLVARFLEAAEKAELPSVL